MFKINKLTNFAVIEKLEEEIELKDLTIFMGDNSSGKSYLAMLIHSFITMSRGYQDKVFLNLIYSEFSNSSVLKKLNQSIEKVIGQENNTLTLLFNEEDKKDLIDIIYFSLNKYLLKEYLPNMLFKCESIDEIEIVLSNLNEYLPSTLVIKNSMTHDMGKIEILIDEESRVGLHFPKDFRSDTIIEMTLNLILSDLIEMSIKQTLPIDSVYLPASRTGYLQTYKSLSNQAILKEYHSDKREDENELSPLIRIFITQLNSHKKYQENDFSTFIEEFIMKGQVNIFEDNNSIDFTLKDGQSVNVNYLSSTVSELIPLVVFLKRELIQKDGLVVIEEPEAHLSFENQKLIAKLIALLLKENIRVLITTHSDFLIYELNNLIMKDRIIQNKILIKESAFKDIIRDDISLDYEKVALYNFILKDNKSTVKRIKVDKYGINSKYIFDNTYALTKEKNKLLDLLDTIDA